MNSDDTALPLSKLLVSLAGSMVDVQAKLTRNDQERLAEFEPILALAKGTPWEGLARTLAPAPLVVARSTIEVQTSFERDVTTEIAVRFLNAGFVSRYGYTNNLRSKITVEVRRVPLGADQANTASSPIEERTK